MLVEKADAVGNVREGKWRLVTDHSYPGTPGRDGNLGGSDTRTTKFHHPRPCCPTPKRVSCMGLECSDKYPMVGQMGYKHYIEATYNLIDVRAIDTKLFAVLFPDSNDDSVWQAVQTTCKYGFKGAFGIYYANIAAGLDAFHGLHRPSHPHINGLEHFRSETYGDDTMRVELDLGLRPWLSDNCARAGIFVTSRWSALSLIKLEEGGALRSTASGIGPTTRLNEGVVMVSGTRVLKTRGRWNNP